jgi:hypothetical protein
MSLIRTLAGVAARCRFDFRLLHLPGVANPLADALSRGQVLEFRRLAMTEELTIDPEPTPILRPWTNWLCTSTNW